jgi:hypothetical protein
VKLPCHAIPELSIIVTHAILHFVGVNNLGGAPAPISVGPLIEGASSGCSENSHQNGHVTETSRNVAGLSTP